MPRDLAVEASDIRTTSPEPSNGPDDGFPPSHAQPMAGHKGVEQEATGPRSDYGIPGLHPYVRPLSLSDLESALVLENAAFPPAERCSREKFVYRLTACPELTLGLFAIARPGSPVAAVPTAATATPASSMTLDQKEVLLAHVVATKCVEKVVSDHAMEMPPKSGGETSTSSRSGHREDGRTIAIHSLAVLPEYQKRGLGTTVLKSYIQRMGSAEVADRISLIAHDHFISLYERLGFKNLGPSTAQFGGGGWFDLVLEFSEVQTNH